MTIILQIPWFIATLIKKREGERNEEGGERERESEVWGVGIEAKGGGEGRLRSSLH